MAHETQYILTILCTYVYIHIILNKIFIKMYSENTISYINHIIFNFIIIGVLLSIDNTLSLIDFLGV